MPQRFDPSRTDFEPYGLSITRWQACSMSQPDRHNEIELNLVPTAPLNYLLGGNRFELQPGTLAAFWAAIPHQIIEPVPDDFYYVATIPLSMFLRFGLPVEMVQTMLNGRLLASKRDALCLEMEPRFETWISDATSGSSPRMEAMALELQALLVRLWAAVQQPVGQCEATHLPKLQQAELSAVERIAAYIALKHTEPLTVDEISRDVGLASGYAMTLYRKVFGQTMMESLLDHRLAHAQRLLINSDRQILTIAYEAGFGSLSRFNAAFKQKCGCSPSRYRKLHRSPTSIT